jgi:hypothetical protein
LEREKINKIVKKLEIDLINAKIDLLEDETMKKCLLDESRNNSEKENILDNNHIIRTYDYSTPESKTGNKFNESKGNKYNTFKIFTSNSM